MNDSDLKVQAIPGATVKKKRVTGWRLSFGTRQSSS